MRVRSVVLIAVIAALVALLALVLAVVTLVQVASTNPNGDESRWVSATSSDGRFELVIASGNATDVYIRQRSKSDREVLVWEGPDEASESVSVQTTEFVGPNRIKITTYGGCDYQTSFDLKTLTPESILGPAPDWHC